MVKVREKEKLNELETTLYDQQKKMAEVQEDIETIGAKTQKMEQEFENEINIQNKDSKQKGMIISSINNIFNICKVQQEMRNKKLIKEDIKISEETKNLVELLNIKLEKTAQTIDELSQVYNEFGHDYNKDQAYAEIIERRNQGPNKGYNEIYDIMAVKSKDKD